MINDSDTYVTFKKDKATGLAEAISITEDHVIHKSVVQLNIEDTSADSHYSHQQSAKHEETECHKLPEHLQSMYENNISDLSEDQKLTFKKLLSDFPDIFSKNDFDLGCLSSGIEHKITTYDEIPIKEKFRRTPLHFQQQEKEYIEKLLKQGVIEPSVSEWSAAPVLVRKNQAN